MFLRGISVLCLTLVWSNAAIASAPATSAMQQVDVEAVELRGLNKVTARVSSIKGKLIEQLEFGNLNITVKSCWSALPGKSPEHAALMDIVENRPGEGPTMIFSGWMFASSPALSALEHPVYDVTMIACHAKK